MAVVNSIISIITLNMNELGNPTKRQIIVRLRFFK